MTTYYVNLEIFPFKCPMTDRWMVPGSVLNVAIAYRSKLLLLSCVAVSSSLIVGVQTEWYSWKPLSPQGNVNLRQPLAAITKPRMHTPKLSSHHGFASTRRQLVISSACSAMSLVQFGIRRLSSAQKWPINERESALPPHMPTLAESGLGGIEFDTMHGIQRGETNSRPSPLSVSKKKEER